MHKGERNIAMSNALFFLDTLKNTEPIIRGDLIKCHIDGLPNLGLKIVCWQSNAFGLTAASEPNPFAGVLGEN